ncbi:MAG TPA: hypothetical protein VF861_17200 [Telluria sp.]
MNNQTASPGAFAAAGIDDGGEARRSGVSWGAIFAGAAAAAALSLVLFLLGSGLGFSALNPYEDNSAKAFGIGTILWLTFTQLAASAIGGYIAGRLRVKWATVHTDEVYFRDTAHGMLAWAVATLLTAALFTGVLSTALTGVMNAGAGVAKATMATGGAAAAAAASDGESGGAGNPLNYFSDMLMRSDKPATDAGAADSRAEIMRIMTTSMANGSLSADDRAYLARTVAARTGIAPADAERRVDEVYAKATTAAAKVKATAKEAADKARKAAAGAALWMTVALLLGAFVASLAATFGGKQRDSVAHTRAPLHR